MAVSINTADRAFVLKHNNGARQAIIDGEACLALFVIPLTAGKKSYDNYWCPLNLFKSYKELLVSGKSAEGATDHRRGCKPPIKSHTV